nr:immunoglobulin heavy chain junction region [Macaca mulatta]
CARQDSDLDYW